MLLSYCMELEGERQHVDRLAEEEKIPPLQFSHDQHCMLAEWVALPQCSAVAAVAPWLSH